MPYDCIRRIAETYSASYRPLWATDNASETLTPNAHKDNFSLPALSLPNRGAKLENAALLLSEETVAEKPSASTLSSSREGFQLLSRTASCTRRAPVRYAQ